MANGADREQRELQYISVTANQNYDHLCGFR